MYNHSGASVDGLNAQLCKVFPSDYDLNLITNIRSLIIRQQTSSITRPLQTLFTVYEFAQHTENSNREAAMPSKALVAKPGFTKHNNEQLSAAELKNGSVKLQSEKKDRRLTRRISQSQPTISSRYTSTPNLRMTLGRHTPAKTPLPVQPAIE